MGSKIDSTSWEGGSLGVTLGGGGGIADITTNYTDLTDVDFNEIFQRLHDYMGA